MVTLTPKAAGKVKDLLAQKQRDDLALRIFVSPGGCRGFSYGMAWDSPADDDAVVETDGVSMVVDALSYQYLLGAMVDYREDLQGAQFLVDNPNAQSTCGCGNSFSI